ncbi:HAMP domain-containing histidine kinase [Actinomycetaceae bacterium TAE3-ERU4]|nr:HAMP domain-containing histidine kinase [Actinomycetaceae bacterium TAE3-ERU4]
MTSTDLLLAVSISLLTGLICAFITLRVARCSVRWAAILSPVSVILAMAAGLLVGMKLMLIETGMVALLILAAVTPAALLIGIFLSIRSQDIISKTTAELEVEKRRREVEEGRRELITWLSHDLRTPLAGIKAMGEALEDGVASDPQLYYRNIITQADRTTAMVNDLMAMASLRSGTKKIQTEAVTLADLVSDLISQLTPLAESRLVKLSGVTHACCSDVIGDPGLLTRALQNIIVNAIQYTAPETSVKVVLECVDNQLHIRVSDHCAGLSKEDLARMFEAGWRGDAARTPGSATGSGLGLPIVRTVVEAHGGKVWAENSPHGCNIQIALPTTHLH